MLENRFGVGWAGSPIVQQSPSLLPRIRELSCSAMNTTLRHSLREIEMRLLKNGSTGECGNSMPLKYEFCFLGRLVYTAGVWYSNHLDVSDIKIPIVIITPDTKVSRVV